MNVLASLDIRTPEALASLPLSALRSIEGAGNRTVEEFVAAKLQLSEQGFRVSEPPLISTRAEAVLFELGYLRSDDLRQLALADAASVPGCGRTVLNEIAAFKHRQQTKLEAPAWSRVEKKYFFDKLAHSLSTKATHALQLVKVQDLDALLGLDLDRLYAVTKPQFYDEIALPLEHLRTFLLAHPSTSADEADEMFSFSSLCSAPWAS